MDLPTLKKEYAYELKEGFFRRAIACAIDNAVISFLVFLAGGFIVAGIMNSNPGGIFVGLLGDVVMKPEVGGLRTSPLFGAMLGFSIAYGLISSIYYGILESGSRRTPGKLIMHLEVVGYLKDPNFLTGIGRNLTKIIAGMIGAYVLGVLGANIGVAIAVLIDHSAAPGSKVDIRQRLSEKAFGTIVMTDQDENDPGSLAVDGAPSIDDSLRGLFDKAKRSQAKGTVKTAEKADAPSASAPRTFGKGFGKGTEPAPADKTTEGPSEKKGFGKPFGGSLMAKKEEKGTEKPAEPALPPVPERIDVPTPKMAPMEAPVGKDVVRDRTVLTFMMDFDIDEARAMVLFDAGYRTKDDLADAIPEDLIAMKGINPTIAKRILSKAKRPDPIPS